MSQYSTCKLSMMALLIALVLCILNLLVSRDLSPMPTELYLQGHKQLVDDWQSLPFVDIGLTNAKEGCPAGYEPMISREWPGTYDTCETESSGSQVLEQGGEECQYSHKVGGLPAKQMTELNGMVLCGKRGGSSFINQTRVRPYKRTCANGLQPCSFHTS